MSYIHPDYIDKYNEIISGGLKITDSIVADSIVADSSTTQNAYIQKLEGYTNKKSYYPGEDIEIMVNSPLINKTELINILEENKINLDLTNFTNNQNSTLNLSNNVLEVISNQNTSTPGIKYSQSITIEPGNWYTLIVNGYKNCECNVYPYIRDTNNNNILGKNIQNNLIYSDSQNGLFSDSKRCAFILNINSSFVSTIQLFFVFHGPEINDTFYINEIYLYKNISQQLEDCINLIMQPSYYNIQFVDRKNTEFFSVNNIKGISQKQNITSFANGCDWDVSYTYKIPKEMISNMYVIKIYNNDGDEFFIPITIKNNKNKNDILVLSNINTWEAYNPWTGSSNEISLYKWNFNENLYDVNKKYSVSGKSCFVNFNRPNKKISGLIKKRLNKSYDEHHWDPRCTGEYYLLEWLDTNSYNYDVVTDFDLHNNSEILDNYKCFIIHNHAEYWTKEMVKQLYKFIKNGGNLMNLAGNAIFWKTTINNNQLEVRKDRSYHTHTNEKGGLWEELQNEIFPLPIPEKITGLRWYVQSWPNLSNKIWGGYKILNPQHWIFENVTDEFIGEDSLNGLATKNGASGWEYDGVVDSAFTNSIIAQGYINNKIYNGNDMIYFENEGKVFSAGSCTYTGALLIDNNISQLTKNVLNKFLE